MAVSPPQAAPRVSEKAPDDQEMPLTDHIEEMVKRLVIVMAVAGLVSAVLGSLLLVRP